MNSVISLIINIPTLFILYIIIYFTQELSGKRQFYGISLNSDYFDNNDFKKLDKKFKFLTTIGFVIFMILAFILNIFKIYRLSSILPIIGFILYHFLTFIYIHKKVKVLKDNLSIELSDLDLEKSKLVLDTNFINEKNKIIKKYSFMFLIPFIITLLMGIYVATQYNNLPDMIPTHFGVNGTADAFSEKSITSVMSIIIMSVGIGFIIYISCIASLKSRGKLNINNLKYSKEAQLYYLNRVAITFLVLNIACQIMFISILVATIGLSGVNPFIMWFCTIVIIVSAIYQTYLYYKSPNKLKAASYTIDDDDSFWILGTIYNNPNDPSLFVQKRFGVGWTVNIGSTKGKLFLIFPLVIIALTCLINL